jgi:hypothetical protein
MSRVVQDIIETHVGSVIALIAAGASDWDNRSMIRNVGVPSLLIHGTADDIIPCTHSEELHELCKAPKRLVLLERVGHQDMDLLYALVHVGFLSNPILGYEQDLMCSIMAGLSRYVSSCGPPSSAGPQHGSAAHLGIEGAHSGPGIQPIQSQ